MTQRILVPRLMSPKEYADYYRVTPRTVQRWVRERAVTIKRIGPRKCVRIVVEESVTDAG